MDLQGTFETDTPKQIIKATVVNPEEKELSCQVEWKKRLNGIQPNPTWYRSSELRIKDPQILLDFMMKHMKFPEVKPKQTK